MNEESFDKFWEHLREQARTTDSYWLEFWLDDQLKEFRQTEKK